MINLIKNEFYKIKISKVLLSYIFYIIILILMNKYSDKNIEEISFNLIPIIEIIICTLFGGTISKEISTGTFRYYLTKPVSRNKIYTSKIMAVFLYGYFSILVVLIFTSIMINKVDLLYYSKFLTYSIPIYFLSSFIVYLSNKINSSSFSIVLGVILFSFSLLFSQIFFKINFKIIQFSFLPYLDFSLFDDKLALKTLNKTFKVILSLKRGVLINIIYAIMFYYFGMISFSKRDIKS